MDPLDPPPTEPSPSSDARRRFAFWVVPDSVADHVRITSCVCVVSYGQRAHPALQSEAAAGVCFGVFTALFAAPSPGPANRVTPPVALPTYQQHSAGSPAVKGALRPTPQGLTTGDPVLQSQVGQRAEPRVLNRNPFKLPNR